MLIASLVMLAGLALLVWSADKFVEGAALTARYAGMPPLLIGMVIIGFGTSAPELTVSALAALQDNSGLALGNAYGSNIANIGLILGTTGLLAPIAVASAVLRRELPLLLLVTLLALFPLLDGLISRTDAALLLLAFVAVMGWSIRAGIREHDLLGEEVEQAMAEEQVPLSRALLWLGSGLLLLILSSRMLVWGAVSIATGLGVSDLVIGLTIVAVGTSLPELASSLTAVRKGEHDLALGNVLGSNLFNTLAVVGLAGVISPIAVPTQVASRDWSVMMAMTLLLMLACWWPRKGHRRIGRVVATLLLLAFVGYNGLLFWQQF